MLQLGRTHLSSSLILAPLAGYSDLPFRQLCREFGAGLCVSEMISCHGLAYRQQKTLSMLSSSQEEKPVSFQLFGADPFVMAKATDILNDFSPDFIDINMGCPVKKVTKKGAGAALMASPEKARQIIQEVVKHSNSPVSVKFRSGVNSSSLSCCDFAKMVEDCGAEFLTIHGRTWSQAFKGSADWSHVTQVKQAVSIPVIGNGDIHSYNHALSAINSGICDGVMIGRASLGNPWIFSPQGRPQTLSGLAEGACRHLTLMEKYLDTTRLLASIKNHIGRYFKDLRGSSEIRKMVYSSNSFSELHDSVLSLTI